MRSFPFSFVYTWHALTPALLVFKVSTEKSVVILMDFYLHVSCFYLLKLPIHFLCFIYLVSWLWCIVGIFFSGLVFLVFFVRLVPVKLYLSLIWMSFLLRSYWQSGLCHWPGIFLAHLYLWFDILSFHNIWNFLYILFLCDYFFKKKCFIFFFISFKSSTLSWSPDILYSCLIQHAWVILLDYWDFQFHLVNVSSF